jgi:hypothetical protein
LLAHHPILPGQAGFTFRHQKCPWPALVLRKQLLFL